MVKARGIDNKIDSLVAIPVTKTRRTLIVPNQAIATYVTQWTYDSHNRLVEMIYPDEEKVTYSYNVGGLLEKVRGEKSYGYDYITKLGYDKFEQRSYLKYCNGAETFYTYDDRRRLSNLAVNSGGTSIMDNAYTFDAVSNVLSVANNASLPANGNAGGQMSHTYTYDGLYRLATATGTYTGADNKSASYTLAMGYDNMHRIKSKSQHLTQDNVQFNGTLNVGYDLTYTYGSEEGKKFQLESVKDVNYRTEETPEGQQIENGHVYSYDKNGNLVYVNTNRVMTDGHRDNSVGERKLIWDEENRLLAVDDNGFVSNYWYDADGERTVKTSGESDQVYVNGVFSGGSTNTAKFSLYVSPYLVANQGGRYTKHIYAGSQRIVSKVGDFASYGSDPRRIEYAGANTDGLSVDYKSKYAAQQQVIKDNYKFFDVPYNGTDNDNYADGEGFCCNDGSMEAAVAEARKAQTRAVSRSFKDPDNYENLQFFYHPDHLGSSSFITNLDGEVVQHIEYVPFGEVFIEERNNVWNTLYLFNAKEFDEETGMYYYGARYYDPRLSLWMSTDPMQEKYSHINTYCYAFNNPLNFVDLHGMEGVKYESDNGDKIIECNVVVLVEEKKKIPSNATPKERAKLERKNEKIERNNQARVQEIREKLNEVYGDAKNSNGEIVQFIFNVMPLEIADPKLRKVQRATQIGYEFGLEADMNPNEGRLAFQNALAVVISQAGAGSAKGSASGSLVKLNDMEAMTISHEVGHTFGLKDNYPLSTGGIMDYPPGSLIPSEVDEIWEKAHTKKGTKK
ncbi:RHS repeat-associated core domain-containing protein [Muribaculaceae bacterium Isolate-042 (Harlan)]|nr:RHS repeat-associated core domain-containing protein [Muribaculaceae bacterium Isolate-042 (Harlan)]